ncbi:hypothetical protein [Sphingomonas rubra]|uniref:WYL domain-containing protein n=1 Tax=Sphingomonas rubra TaxID=634430 RepID=A0A1I5RZ26_9SPHN|nr:hypothetical protein [Sphingomonas rubra]SFP63755.1 hypothetical protein SAMN04488241_104233 [Sphingomonas rubra]
MTEMTSTIDRPTAAPSPATIFEAIVKQVAVVATYNRGEVTLAPHAIYTRADEVYVDALTVEREGKPPKEEKIGTFKLAGLGGLRVTPRRFSVSPLYQGVDKRYEYTMLMEVDRTA